MHIDNIMANMAKNVRLLFVVIMVVVTGYLALSVPSAEAFDYFNILSIPSSNAKSNSDDDSKLGQPTNVSELVEASAPPPSQFDYFKLAVQWPPTYCKFFKGCKLSPLPEFFTIHGLWPENSKTCPKVSYTRITDKALLKEMEEKWPDLERGKDPGQWFWKHEWEYHGTCSLSKFNQKDYFNKALELHSKYNVVDKLKSQGITPGAGKKYEKARITQAIKALTSMSPDLRCKENSDGQYLLEVHICFTREVKVMDCPPRKSSERLFAPPEFPTKRCTAKEIFFPKDSN